MSSRLLLIDFHPAVFLLRNCFSIPKLLYILRSSPCNESPDELGKIDGILRKCALMTRTGALLPCLFVLEV